MLSDSTLGEFFRAAIDIPEIPFGEMLWESAQRFPEKIALVFQGHKISYRELDGLANSCANALAKLGVKKGEIEHQLNDADASVLVGQESLYPLVRNVRPQLPSLREIVIVGQRAEAG